MGSEGEARIRLTKSVRQQLLDQNDGYTDQTYYRGENFREQRDYEIRDGQLHVRSRGKTSWADSRFDEEFVADDEQTRRFLRNNLRALNTEGLEPRVTRTIGAGSERDSVQPAISAPEGLAEDLSYSEFADSDDDDDEDPDFDRAYGVVGAALIAFFAAQAVAPHVKRWWSESLAPRARRARQRVARGEPSVEPAEEKAESAKRNTHVPRP